MSKVGFLGLGNMGGPMARNVLAAGHSVMAFDVVPEALSALVEAGATAAASAREAVVGADIVISMLPAGRHVRSVYLDVPEGANGCLLDDVPGTALIIDCSTIDADTARLVAGEASARGLGMLDAPVSGGTGGAIAGTLTFIVGGAAADLERARDVLGAMGANIFHAGDSGAGQVAKICNNMLLAVQMTATAEALSLGVANGLDPATLSAIMQRSSGSNWALTTYNPYPGVMPEAPAGRGYEGGFLVDLMIKDLGLAMAAAESSQSSTPMGGLARSLYLMLREQHDAGRLDFSVIQRLYGDT